MSTRHKVLLTSAFVVVALVAWFFVLPMLQYSAAKKKFRLGMTLEEAQRIARKPFRAISTEGGVIYFSGTNNELSTTIPPENMKQSAISTEMYCDADRAVLLFNYYNKLVEIRPYGSLIDMILWKQTRGW